MSVQPKILYHLTVGYPDNPLCIIGAPTMREAQVAAEAISRLPDINGVRISLAENGHHLRTYSAGRELEGRFAAEFIPRFTTIS